MPKALFFSTLLLIVAGCARSGDQQSEAEEWLNSEACLMPNTPSKEVSLPAALADPQALTGQFVTVTGFYCADFELSAIYETADCRTPPDDGLWISGVSPFHYPEGKQIIVTGRLDTGYRGHLAQWPASLCAAKIEQVP